MNEPSSGTARSTLSAQGRRTERDDLGLAVRNDEDDADPERDGDEEGEGPTGGQGGADTDEERGADSAGQREQLDLARVELAVDELRRQRA